MSGCCAFGSPAPRLYTFTDGDGRYAFTGLGSGAFSLGASDPAGLYATTYYTNQSNPLQASPINIPNDQVLTNYNLDLPRAGAIRGLVRQRNQKAVAGLALSLYWLDPKPDYALMPTESYTDDAGRYMIAGLRPGRYTVCFSRIGYPVRTECYTEPVSVTAGATTADINLIWGLDPPLYLPFVKK